MRNLILPALLLASAFQTALGEQAGDWTYTVSNNQATITGYTGAGGAVTIPSEVNGIPVVQVGNGSPLISGWRNDTVTSLTIPNSVVTIGIRAFYRWVGLSSVTIGNNVTSIGDYSFIYCSNLSSIYFPNSVKTIGDGAFELCTSLATVTLQEGVETIGARAFLLSAINEIILPLSLRSVGQSAFIKFSGWGLDADDQPLALLGSLDSITIPERLAPSVASMTWYKRREQIPGNVPCEVSYLMTPKAVNLTSIGSQYVNNADFINALANNDAFVTAVANKIKATGGNYGIATQSGLSSAIESLATKSELTSSLAQSRTDGINSVLSNPNLWTLYTTSQIQNMAVGDLVLTRQVSGGFVLNYDIEQSTDLQTWTPYQALSLPLTGLPTDKAFVRIKAKQ
jgi:BspA type Leucine rich repeat region (6 copies)